MPGYFLGVDIGTYSSKGVLVRDDGTVIASHAEPHALAMPQPGWYEHDAEATWWHDFVAITRAVLAQSGIPATGIAAIGVSSISPAIVPVDADGNALRPAILYGIDTRATQEIAAIEQALGGGDAFFRRYAMTLSAQSAAPKIRWIRTHEPAIWRATRLILGGAGYIVWRLTGSATIDHYDAGAYAPLYDPATLAWDPVFADLVAPVEWMAQPTWTCAIAGHVNAAAAAATGLAAGTLVISGTADAAAEAVSAGLAATGDMMIMVGSTVFFIVRTEQQPASRRFWGGRFLEPGSFALAGGMATAGSLTRWFRDTLGHPEVAAESAGGDNAYAALAALATQSPPGANGVLALPYFAGERTPLHDPDARGLFIGLSLATTRADLYRALLESVGYGIRHNLDEMAREGVTARRILAVGGGTLNDVWMQIVSDIVGIEQRIPAQQIGAAYGDAMLAAVGAGYFTDCADAVRAWVRAGRIVTPDPAQHARYEPYYRIYRDLYGQSAPAMHALSRLQAGAGHP